MCNTNAKKIYRYLQLKTIITKVRTLCLVTHNASRDLTKTKTRILFWLEELNELVAQLEDHDLKIFKIYNIVHERLKIEVKQSVIEVILKLLAE